jgi:phosphoenolpyruvate carboxykinase (GTP)
MRVLEWIIKRCQGEAGCVDTPIGKMPDESGLNLEGIEVPVQTMEALLEVDTNAWVSEISEIGDYLDSFGERTPAAIKAEQARVATALDNG